MRVVSFNVNGIRARPHQLEALKAQLDPDVIGLQETKVQDSEFPEAMIRDLGYAVCYFGQKGHYGVALLSKQAPKNVLRGLPEDGEDAQRRLISADYAAPDGGVLRVINGYFPQGENRDHAVKFPAKRKFYADLAAHLEQGFDPRRDRLVVMGDMNVARLDQDIGIGPQNAKRWLREGKTSFLPEERAWLARIMDWGMTDSFRQTHPEADDRYSWFDYRSRGFDRDPKRGLRIDLILLSQALEAQCADAGIAYEIRGLEKPSDHCPIWADLRFE